MDYLRSQGIIRNDADFAAKIGKNRPMVSEYVNGRRNVTPAFAMYVASAFPELNPEWLYSDKSDAAMLCDGSTPVVAGRDALVNNGKMRDQIVGQSDAELIEIIKKQQAQIDRLLTIIEKQQEQ